MVAYPVVPTMSIKKVFYSLLYDKLLDFQFENLID